MVNVKNMERLPERTRAHWYHRENTRWIEINKFLEKYPDSYGWLRELVRQRDEDIERLDIAISELDSVSHVKKLDVEV
jgi:hypothetical protein